MYVFRKGSFIIPLLIACTLLFVPIATVPVKAFATYTLNVDILEPTAGTEIPYCTIFTVKAHVNAPDEILDNVKAQIILVGNATVESGAGEQSIASLG